MDTDEESAEAETGQPPVSSALKRNTIPHSVQRLNNVFSANSRTRTASKPTLPGEVRVSHLTAGVESRENKKQQKGSQKETGMSLEASSGNGA